MIDDFNLERGLKALFFYAMLSRTSRIGNL